MGKALSGKLSCPCDRSCLGCGGVKREGMVDRIDSRPYFLCSACCGIPAKLILMMNQKMNDCGQIGKRKSKVILFTRALNSGFSLGFENRINKGNCYSTR